MVVVKIAYFRDIYHHGLRNSLGSGLNGPRRCCLVLRIAFDSSPQSSSYTVYYVWWVYVELLLLGEESNRWKLFAVATALGFGVHTTATVYCAISQKKNSISWCVVWQQLWKWRRIKWLKVVVGSKRLLSVHSWCCGVSFNCRQLSQQL